MKFAAASDLHGQCASLCDLLARAKGLGAEFLVLAGDLTNAEYDGYSAGMKQIEGISSIIESSGLDLVYILGNRDRAGGRLVRCHLPGDLSLADVEIEGFVFTSVVEGLDDRSIYVCHSLDSGLRVKRSDALLVLYGHDHVPRIFGNYVGLGYLNGRDVGKTRGGFFMVNLGGETPLIDYVDMGGMMASRCRIHANQGTFFVPSSWGRTCPMCRNDEKYRFHFS